MRTLIISAAGFVTVHQFTDAPDINIDRALANAPAAAHTLNAVMVFIHIIFKFVHKSLSHPFGFGTSRIMAGAVKSEKRIHAAVPVAHPEARLSADLILNVETPAGRANVSAGP